MSAKRYISAKLISMVICIGFLQVTELSAQARIVINNASAVYMRMSGGTQGTPIYLVIDNAAANAITCGSAGAVCPASGSLSWIISEGQYNHIKWRQVLATTHVFPFGNAGSDYLPLTVAKSTAGAADLLTSTWPAASDNTPWAGISDLGAAAAVSNMYSSVLGQDGAVEAVIDRWWDIYATAATTANLTFSYRGAENTMTSAPTGVLGMQHWTGTDWNDGKGGGNGTYVNTGSNGVTSGIGTATATGITEFTPFILISQSAPLPVQWLDLSAGCSGSDIEVKWSTATEQDADYFNVERSADGSYFYQIDQVPASGNSSTVKSYTYLDTDPLPGKSYYRIQETDFNGATMLSDQVSARPCEGIGDLSVFPNPVPGGSTFQVAVSGQPDSEVLIVVKDMLGRDFYSKVIILSNEKEIVAIDPSNSIAAGMYTVVASSNDEIFQRRIVIQ